MALTPGTRLGVYEILAPLGAGGMGEVYRARDTRLDRTVAIKTLPEALAADPQFRDRFEREARAISSLDHPHICAIYDVGEAQVLAGAGSHEPSGLRSPNSDTNKGTAIDIFIAPIDGSTPPALLVHSKAHATGGRVSPTGRWLAFVSDDSGRDEVYVQPLRADHPRAQVSRAGGTNIKWGPNGKELFYIEGSRLMAADVSASATFEAGAPRVVFTPPGTFIDYDVSADGQRFLLIMLDREAEAGTLSAIMNWPSLLKK
jgi:hypothetical protein